MQKHHLTRPYRMDRAQWKALIVLLMQFDLILNHHDPRTHLFYKRFLGDHGDALSKEKSKRSRQRNTQDQGIFRPDQAVAACDFLARSPVTHSITVR